MSSGVLKNVGQAEKQNREDQEDIYNHLQKWQAMVETLLVLKRPFMLFHIHNSPFSLN